MTRTTRAPANARRPGAGPGQPLGLRRWAILGVLCTSLLIVSLDSTVLNVALPVLARDLPASSSQLQWIVDAYAIRVMDVITGSLGGALGVAARVGGTLGEELASAGRAAFLSGMDLALTVGAVVAGVAALGVLALLPPRAERSAPKAESPRGSAPAPR